MSHALRGGLARLESTTRLTLAVLALASGVYTYLGVRGLLNGTPLIVFFGAIIYSAAVSVAIYAFWSYLMRLLPHVRRAGSRGMLYLAMAIGSAMIIAMSSWLNAAALAGGAALEQHMALAIERYQQSLNVSYNNALAAQSLLPDIQLAKGRFARLSDEEQRTGALTGTSGSGTVVQLLRQMSTQLDGLAQEVEGSRVALKSLYKEGSRHLARMRSLVSSSEPIEARSGAFAEEAVALSAVVASLEQTSVAPAVKRAAEDLGKSFIAPAADGRTADLALRQNEVVDRVERSVKAQSQALAIAADEILARPAAEPLKFAPISTPEAVLIYAEDFLPSWAGAISIDLLPAVLIFIMVIVQGAIRREESGEPEGMEVTAGEMMQALRLARALGDEEVQLARLVTPQAARASDQAVAGLVRVRGGRVAENDER